MCPFSLLARFWIIVFVLFCLCQYTLSQIESKWNITCDPDSPQIFIDETISVHCNVTGTNGDQYFLQIQSQDPGILDADKQVELVTEPYTDVAMAQFNITGVFLGRTSASLKVLKNSITYYNATMPVTIVRKTRVIDHIFTGSVATLVALIYINFGCALDWSDLRQGLRRPIGPAIGFISQFIFMPLLSYGLGKVLFPHNTDMQLGMFFTGAAPGGGASNMWTAILNANLSLSIIMTTISNIAAFAMMPLWLFTLGKEIFDKSEIPVPYTQISTYVAALVVPLFIGYLIQKYCTRIARFMARILKAASGILLLFIIIFAIVTNLYLFELFSWQIIVSGLGLPWLGYALAWIFAKLCRQSSKDALTIAIEAGIQNTGISIFLLRAVLPQPEADLTTVAPVAVAIMTPFPLLLLFVIQRIKQRLDNRKDAEKILNGSEADAENAHKEENDVKY